MQSFQLIIRAANWIESGVIVACIIIPLFFLKNRISRWLWLMPVCAGFSLAARIAWNVLLLLLTEVQNSQSAVLDFSEVLMTAISFLSCLGQLAFGGAIVALLLTIRDVARQLDSLDEQIERARFARSAAQ